MRRIAVAIASLAALYGASAASASVTLTAFSSDPYTNTTSQHKTEVEPDTFAFGSTEVSTYQAGRFADGGASNIGFATTTNGGTSWTSGFLSGITTFAGGSFSRATDPAVAYDAHHGVWLINSLALNSKKRQVTGAAVLVNRSTTGTTWGSPVTVARAARNQDFDKNWIACDNTAASPHYGNCYVTFDDFNHGDKMKFSTSTDGGLTWSTPVNTADNANGLGGQPLVQADGTVIVPFANAFETAILATKSTDGGASWTTTTVVTTVASTTDPGNVRSGPLPSAEIDGSGRVYVVWEDCRFESNCSGNDIVMSTSTDGTTWSAPVGIPADAAGSGVDHLIPGLAVDPSTSGTTANLGLTYYFFPSGSSDLSVGFVSSTDSGGHWSSPTTLASGISPTWLASTTQGRMVGDYISTSFLGGSAQPVFATASAPSPSGALNESMVTPSTGLAASGGTTAVFPSSSALVSTKRPNPSEIHSAKRQR